jgi:hypothetical protein
MQQVPGKRSRATIGYAFMTQQTCQQAHVGPNSESFSQLSEQTSLLVDHNLRLVDRK